MGGVDKLVRVARLANRCWRGRSRRCPAPSRWAVSSSSRAPDRVAELAAAADGSGGAHGRCRRRTSVRFRSRRRRGHERRRRAGSRRRAAARVERARRRGRARRGRTRRRSARDPGRRLAEACLGDASRPSVDREGLVRTQTPQGARRDCCSPRSIAPAGVSPTRTKPRSSKRRGIARRDGSRRASQHQGHGPGRPRDRRAPSPARAAAAQPTSALAGGEDSHGVRARTMGLMLGGVVIADAPRLYGHSDGDVVLHALATAILSAAGLGDLGRLFPPTIREPRALPAASSWRRRFAQARSQGWSGRSRAGLDRRRPTADRRSQAGRDGRGNSPQLVGSEPGSVSVIASTGNLSGTGAQGV